MEPQVPFTLYIIPELTAKLEGLGFIFYQKFTAQCLGLAGGGLERWFCCGTPDAQYCMCLGRSWATLFQRVSAGLSDVSSVLLGSHMRPGTLNLNPEPKHSTHPTCK